MYFKIYSFKIKLRKNIVININIKIIKKKKFDLLNMYFIYFYKNKF